LFQSSRRKNLNNINSQTEEKNLIEKKEMDFDNCNVYLKGEVDNQNRLSSRKRSAYKFIENTMDKNPIGINSSLTTNTVKSTKDPLSDKITKELGSQINNLNLKKETVGQNIPFMKNSITSTNAINNTPVPDKKPEYQSRRKNQNNTNNILGELDNPRFIDININSSTSNKSEIDKIDHSNFSYRKNNNKEAGTLNTNFPMRDMMVAENYKKTTLSTNITGESNLGIFNSRRHVTNTSTINSFNTSSQGSPGLSGNNTNTKPKDKNKFLII
jgi:hypothetical protein